MMPSDGGADDRMNVRFHIDPETGQPHIYEHGVTEAEALQVLHCPERLSRAEATRGLLSAKLWQDAVFKWSRFRGEMAKA